MRRKRYLVLPVILILVLVIVSAVPTSAAWGANWGTGSVISNGTVTGLKNAQKNGALVVATVGPYGATLVNGVFTGSGGLPGIVYCGNPGTNTKVVQGVNPVVEQGNFAGSELIASSQIDKNGKAPFNVHAQVNLASLNAQLAANLYCPGGNNKNTNWTLVDFVPQQFSGLLQGFDGSNNLLTQAIYDCQISWSVLKTLQYQQQYPYTCVERLSQRVN